jgi:dUTP pyrophosphatase
MNQLNQLNQFHTLKIKVINSDQELINFYKNNSNILKGDSGINLVFPFDINLKSTVGGPGTLIPLGVQCEMDYPGGYDLRPRSSIYKTGIRMANAPGLIDQGYRGEIKIAADILFDHKVKKLDSVVQIVAPDLKPIKVILVDDLSITDRGEGGFGSTDKMLKK